MPEDSTRPNPVSQQPRIFYGYIIVIASVFIFIAYAGARSAFGIFFNPMANEFGWSAAALSIAFSISIIMDGGLGIIMGRITDRLGPRAVLTFSGILMGGGYLLMTGVSSIWQMCLIYGIVVVTGMSGGFVPIVTSLSRWFIARRSIMNGIVLSGMGIGQLITPPIANWLVYGRGWRESYFILGIAILLVIGLAAQFLRKDPAQVGQLPYNRTGNGNQVALPETRSYTLKEAISTGRFWLAFAIFFSIGFIGISLIVHIVPHIIGLGISASTGAAVLATVGGINIAGRLVLGAVADRIGNRRTYIIGYAMMVLVLIWLVFIGETWQFFLFAVLFGFGQGGLGSAQAPIVAELFGLKSHGLIFGSIGFGAMVGGTIGPIMMGYIFDITGSYQTAFIICAVLAVIGFILTLILARLRLEVR